MFRETETNLQMSLFEIQHACWTRARAGRSAGTDKRTGETYEAKLIGSGALRIPYPGDRTKYKWHYFGTKWLFLCHIGHIGHLEGYVADFRTSDFLFLLTGHT